MSKLHEIFCTCYLCPWLDLPLTTVPYDVLPVLWMMSCFYIMGHVQITCHNSNVVWLWRQTMHNDVTGRSHLSLFFVCLVLFTMAVWHHHYLCLNCDQNQAFSFLWGIVHLIWYNYIDWYFICHVSTTYVYWSVCRYQMPCLPQKCATWFGWNSSCHVSHKAAYCLQWWVRCIIRVRTIPSSAPNTQYFGF